MDVEEFKKEVIEQLEKLISKGNEIFFCKSSSSGFEHISGPVKRIVELARIIKILSEATKKIKEGGERDENEGKFNSSFRRNRSEN